MSAAYIEHAPEFSIKNGVACVRAMSGDDEICWHLPLLAFRKGLAVALRTLAAHDASGEVVTFVRHYDDSGDVPDGT